MPFAAILGWFLKNPAWIVVILLGIFAGVQTFRLNTAEAGEAKAKLEFSDFKTDLAEKSLKLTQESNLKSAEEVRKLGEQIQNLSAIGTQAKTEIRYVQSNGGPCAADPVYRATLTGVSNVLQGSAGGDKVKAGPQPSPAVRGAPAAGPVKKPQ